MFYMNGGYSRASKIENLFELFHLLLLIDLSINLSIYKQSWRTLIKAASPNPEEDDSLSAKEEESTWSCDRPSISGMESSEDGTEES